MRERVQFLVIYLIFWVVFFLSARIIFLGFHIEDAKLLTLETIGGVFWYGVQMDFSMAAYLSIIPFILVIFSNHIKKSRLENWIFSYTFFMVAIFSLLIVTDLQVFNIWGYRLDLTPFNYVKSTSDAWDAVRSSPFIPLTISFILLLIVASYIVYRIITKNIDNWNHINDLPMIPIVSFLTIALLVPIRGGLQASPISQSSVYFSENNFANIAAVNAPWNFFYSVINKRFEKVNPYTYLPKHELGGLINELFSHSNQSENVLKKEVESPNVLLIILQNFSIKTLSQKITGAENQELTPNFNRLKAEGIYFSKVYATANRTYKVLPSILSAYLPQPKESILDNAQKTAKLPILSKEFEQNSYTTSFYFGGEPELFKLKNYLYGSYFQKLITKKDFDKKDFSSKWGANDGAVLQRLSEDLNKSQEHFFATLLSLSGQEPFSVPFQAPNLNPKNFHDAYLNSVIYTDTILGNFIENAKQQAWWQNTLVIIVGDYATPLPANENEVASHQVPMLWLGGVIEKKGIEVNKICSQADIAATVLNQLQLKSDNFPFSKNIFDTHIKPWAYFTFADSFGFIQPNRSYVFDNVSKKLTQQEGTISTKDIDFGKAIEQRSYQDFIAN